MDFILSDEDRPPVRRKRDYDDIAKIHEVVVCVECASEYFNYTQNLKQNARRRFVIYTGCAIALGVTQFLCCPSQQERR